jgi:hypothetical protein
MKVLTVLKLMYIGIGSFEIDYKILIKISAVSLKIAKPMK